MPDLSCKTTKQVYQAGASRRIRQKTRYQRSLPFARWTTPIMTSIRIQSSLAYMKMFWIRVAKRTLQQFTAVTSTGDTKINNSVLARGESEGFGLTVADVMKNGSKVFSTHIASCLVVAGQTAANLFKILPTKFGMSSVKILLFRKILRSNSPRISHRIASPLLITINQSVHFLTHLRTAFHPLTPTVKPLFYNF